MKTLLYLSGSIALLTLAVSAAVVCVDVHSLAKESKRVLDQAGEAISTQNVNLAQDEMHLDLVLGELEGTASQLNGAAKEQQVYWAKISADSDKTVKALRLTTDRIALLADHTDKALTGYLLPDVDRQMNFTADRLQATLDGVSHASDALTFQINDVGPIIANLSESSAQLALASQHANKILADGEHTADYYEKRLTTPASFAHRVGMTLLDVGSKLGNIMAGFVGKP